MREHTGSRNKLIGSNSIGKLKHSTDYDLQEVMNIKSIKSFHKFAKNIQKMFTKIRNTKNVYITDFKAGSFKTQPVRWKYDDIINGNKMIDDGYNISLVDALQGKDKIKIDLIVFSNDRFVEYSCNYYFSKNTVDVSRIHESLLLSRRTMSP